MRFGLSTHLFHHERLTHAHVDAAATHGFDALEIFATRAHFDYHDARAIDDLRGWLEARHMTAGSLHAPIGDRVTGGQWGRLFSNATTNAGARQESVDETIVAIGAARRLGCQTVVLHLGVPDAQGPGPAENDPGSVRRSLDAITEAAIGADVNLALEIMPNALSTPDALMQTIDGLDTANVGVCLDLGHAHLMDGATESIELLGGHVIATHLHDNAGRKDDHLVPFDGTIDWRASMTAFWKVGYEGPLVFEVADRGDAAGVLERTVGARTRLQGILDGLSEPFSFKET